MPFDPGQDPMTAVVLAGDRSKSDALVERSGAGAKALLDLGGEPMVLRVLRALGEARAIRRVVLAGPEREAVDRAPALVAYLEGAAVEWQPPRLSPSTSAYEVMQEIPPEEPVLLTTADHPLLTAEIVDAFARQSLADNVDVTVGLAPHAVVLEGYPGIRKTVLRFSDGEFCGCNLFAFLTPEGRQIAAFWRKIEQQRKKPLRVIGMLGWWAVIRYRLGFLPLEEALAKLGKRLGLRIRAVVLPYANAAIDVDSIADLDLVKTTIDQ
jgi:molybdopterin-guanine dinucleotide biosynthesis protein A